MEMRPLGRSGIMVSELGLGCEGLLEGDAKAEALLEAAARGGINLLDMYSPAPAFRKMVGRVLPRLPQPLVLQGHLCSVWEDGQYQRTRDVAKVRQGFETLLEDLGVSSIDIGMIHYVDSLSDWNEVAGGAVLEYAKELRASGAVRLIGLSSHNPEAALAACRTGLIDVLMFAVNPCYDLQPPDEDVEQLWADEKYAGTLINMDPEREALYLECQRRGIAVTAMKAFGGGDLLQADTSPAGAALSENACLQYALTRPGVCSVLAGVRSEKELQELLAFESADRSKIDYARELAAFPRIRWEGHCMYCGHCAPCPARIDVAFVEKLYHLADGPGGIPETVREHYAALPAKASDCLECGACEERCPFGVEVRSEMKGAAELFGS